MGQIIFEFLSVYVGEVVAAMVCLMLTALSFMSGIIYLLASDMAVIDHPGDLNGYTKDSTRYLCIGCVLLLFFFAMIG
jgi:hypothetical protein